MEKIIDFDINEDILDSNKIAQIEELCKNGFQLNTLDVELLLRNLSYVVRKKIADYEGVNMSEYSYSYKCDLAQSMICFYLRRLGIMVNPINTNEVINGVCGHSIVIATFNTALGEKRYLLDPTYMQFFSKNKCNINNFVIINDTICITPDPGFFVAESNKENIILPLLKDGYIEFTFEVAKVYGDSFFKTKQGVSTNQINNNVASGSTYINWFLHYTSNLSKTEDELRNMNLLIDSIDGIKKSRR